MAQHWLILLCHFHLSRALLHARQSASAGGYRHHVTGSNNTDGRQNAQDWPHTNMTIPPVPDATTLPRFAGHNLPIRTSAAHRSRRRPECIEATTPSATTSCCQSKHDGHNRPATGRSAHGCPQSANVSSYSIAPYTHHNTLPTGPTAGLAAGSAFVFPVYRSSPQHSAARHEAYRD